MLPAAESFVMNSCSRAANDKPRKPHDRPGEGRLVEMCMCLCGER